MYPLLVACKSISNLRRQAAQEVVDKVRQHSGVLVEEVKMECHKFLGVIFFIYLTVILELNRPNLYPSS